MFKSLTIAIMCLATVPVISPTLVLAQSHDSTIAQSMNYQRSPEALERQRLREKSRQRAARRRQTAWRQRYGDLAPVVSAQSDKPSSSALC